MILLDTLLQAHTHLVNVARVARSILLLVPPEAENGDQRNREGDVVHVGRQLRQEGRQLHNLLVVTLDEAVNHLEEKEAAHLRFSNASGNHNNRREVDGKNEEILMASISVGVSAVFLSVLQHCGDGNDYILHNVMASVNAVREACYGERNALLAPNDPVTSPR